MSDERIARARDKLGTLIGLRARTRREQLAWAAGFFDGEGSVIASRRRDGYVRVAISLPQIDDPDRPGEPAVALFRFRDAVGGLGTFYRKPPSGLGKRYGWTYFAASFEHSQAIVAMLWEWLSPRKREQALQALARRQHWELHKRRQPVRLR